MLQRSTMRTGSGLSNGSSRPHRGQHDASDPQRRPVRNWVQKSAHLGALIAAKPRIHGMIRDAVWAGLLPEQILETRLSEVIETATSTISAHLTVMNKLWTVQLTRHFVSCSEHALIVAHHTAWLKNVLVRVMSSARSPMCPT